MNVTIGRLGVQGDGLADVDGQHVIVPLALPGECVDIEVTGDRGHLMSVLEPSPERIAPFCPHFGVCGGCRLQHMAAPAVAQWKQAQVSLALARVGVSAEVRDTVLAHGDGRRRATFHVRFDHGRAKAGFMAARSHDLVDLAACPVLVPELRAAPDLARLVSRPFSGFGKPLDVQVTATGGGIDVDIRGAGKVDSGLRLRLTEVAAALDLARLAVHGDTIVERRAPFLRMGLAVVVPPPGGFLQATAAGEATLAALVDGAMGKARKVAELFCGTGPFALRLAEKRPVDAFDSAAPAIAAMIKAARSVPALRPIHGEARDLFRRPLLPGELKAYDALVLDPPRAGAEAQVRLIAQSRTIPTLVYVSCDPGTFARDAAILCGAGYRLESVTPVDQFAHSTHIELAAVFRLG